ncbi:MAG TPA: hypothetical protein VFJ02_16485 [Vicinamibacterales bacterium]|nr:hypothetical protein [Vicinamibacterales bacterium]
MRIPSPFAVGVVACLTLAALPGPPALASRAQISATPALTDAEMEAFLLKASIGRTRGAGKGITGSLRATLSDGTLTHDAHIQTIDESKQEFRSASGTEFNFRDSWMFNVAAYKIDRMIGLRLVPVTVSRRFKSDRASFTWWVDDVMMDEAERLKKKIAAPDPIVWNEEMQLVRLFDQLIYNIDRNLGNLVITKDWTMWAIDHTRAFRNFETLKTPGNIARCDRKVFAGLKALDKATLQKQVGEYLQQWQIDSLLKRRDAIVAMLEQRGEAALFDRQSKRP